VQLHILHPFSAQKTLPLFHNRSSNKHNLLTLLEDQLFFFLEFYKSLKNQDKNQDYQMTNPALEVH
jgi:hypothetical protein